MPSTTCPPSSRPCANISISFRRNRRTGRNELFLNGANREDDIRQMRISNSVSEVSVIPMVRHAMVAQQQRMGRKRGVVMDGRDIGTTVFPDAEVKIFMTAEVELRARRRQDELAAKGEIVPLEEIVDNLRKRDHLDSTRAESPLRRAPDAVLLDTTHITITEQVDFVLDRVSSALFAAGGSRTAYHSVLAPALLTSAPPSVILSLRRILSHRAPIDSVAALVVVTR